MNLGKFFLNSVFNLDGIPWGGALKIIATNLKMTPKQMLGSCKAFSIF
jgi:Mg2+/citrate symporter